MVVSVRVGYLVTLECESNAVPPPTITWYKNGRAVTESANLRILAEGQMLEIKGAEVRDGGREVYFTFTSLPTHITLQNSATRTPF